MSEVRTHPKLHNAMWPGLVGKGPGSEPAIGLDTMLRLTAEGEVEGQRFDGVDLFLSTPHVDIDSGAEELKKLARSISGYDLVIGSLVAPVWPETGGGSAMGDPQAIKRFLGQVEKACRAGSILREIGIRTYGVIRIDSAVSPGEWARDPAANTLRIADTFLRAADIADRYQEQLAAEGEICWGGMHSWRKMVNLLKRVNRPQTLGFQADLAHTLLYALGYNAPEDRILPNGYDWTEADALYSALDVIATSLRPWMLDFHVAQNDASVRGSGTHDKTGRHCLPCDPNGKLDIVRAAGLWLRDEGGEPLKRLPHICWDGCMFPNETMLRAETWNEILAAMIAVRNAHGWVE